MLLSTHSPVTKELFKTETQVMSSNCDLTLHWLFVCIHLASCVIKDCPPYQVLTLKSRSIGLTLVALPPWFYQPKNCCCTQQTS